MNRGSMYLLALERGRPYPFNEAPIHESGKLCQATELRTLSLAFNEAPIHESGKSGRCTRRPAARFTFNEAPIHESGKCDGGRIPRPDGPVPSMRPRFMNRGSYHRVRSADLGEPPSMRPRFMNRGSASMFRPRGCRRPLQ